MPRLTTIETTLDCDCSGAEVYDLRGWNGVGKPLVACRSCDDVVAAPIGAMESDPRVKARRRVQLATDGGGR